MRSGARNRRSVIGSVEQRASTSPLAEVRYSGRPTQRSGNTMPIMKFAVCSMSSTARRNPPSVMRGTLAVAALPTGFMRRSSIPFVPLLARSRRRQFIEDDTDQLALGAAEGCDDVFHGVVDVEVDRQHRDQAVGGFEQFAIGRAPWHRRSVQNHKIVVAAGTRLRDRF